MTGDVDMSKPTQGYLLDVFDYCPDSGELTRKNRPGVAIRAPCTGGYYRVNINQKIYRVHRIIWMMVYGYWPNCVDHIDRDRKNNRLSNLRDVSHAANIRNRGLQSNNKSGQSGVYWNRECRKWAAQVTTKRKTTSLGLFDTIPDAVAARNKKLNEMGVFVAS